MIVSCSRLRFRHWVTGLLLTAYGSAAVLGYGLHDLWECEHRCHVHAHADVIAHSHLHGPGSCHHHDREPVITDSGGNHTAIQSAIDNCPICEFLVQAQTPVVMEFTMTCVGLALSILAPLGSTYVAPLLSASVARGPPLG